MKKKIIIFVIVIFLVFELLIMISPGKISFNDSIQTISPTQKLTSKLEINDTKIGTGSAVKSGDSVILHYKGTLADGTEFDSSYKRGEPFQTTIGTGAVIKGWDQGIPGMKIGGKRKLTIPSDLGYGATGSPPIIPPNATLIFEVELLEIK